MNATLRRFILCISIPLCIVLAITGLQVFWPGIYRETRIAAGGAFASDLIDLFLVVPVLALSTLLAVRGSFSALLVWIGTLGFLVYNFLIYAFAVHFNPMFLAYCAVLGLSFYGLIGIRELLPFDEVAKRYTSGTPRRTTAIAFLFIAVSTVFGEVKEIVTAIHAGQIPARITEAGQLTNPIHVLDLCFLLPAVAIAGILLLRRKPLGFIMAPVLMVTLILIAIEVVTIVFVFYRNGLPLGVEPLILFGVTGVFLTVLLVWSLRPTHKAARHATMSA